MLTGFISTGFLWHKIWPRTCVATEHVGCFFTSLNENQIYLLGNIVEKLEAPKGSLQ